MHYTDSVLCILVGMYCAKHCLNPHQPQRWWTYLQIIYCQKDIFDTVTDKHIILHFTTKRQNDERLHTLHTRQMQRNRRKGSVKSSAQDTLARDGSHTRQTQARALTRGQKTRHHWLHERAPALATSTPTLNSGGAEELAAKRHGDSGETQRLRRQALPPCLVSSVLSACANASPFPETVERQPAALL